jgi:ABC-2 type transport system ATP-binding protein
LIHDPSVLVLDEPAAGLDPRARIELRELIQRLATDLHKTVLISSHILTELGEICDSAAIIEAGRLLASGTITEINQAQRASEGRCDGSAISVRVLRDAETLEHLLCQDPLRAERGARGPGRHVRVHGGVESELSALLKRLVRAELEVVEFRGRVDSLEDAFMAITKGITQ